MKIKLTISLLLISVVMFYSFERMGKTSAEQTTTSEPPKTDFILGAMSNVFDNTMYNYLSDSLKFNMWHLYAGPVKDYGWTDDYGVRISSDTLGGNTSNYGSLIRDRISQNSQNKLMTLMQRPVTTYFAYGQRSDYQMEESTKVDPYYFFYTYNFSRVNSPSIIDTQDYSRYGSGEYVKKCLYNRSDPGSNAGLIVSGLKGNMEQANTYWPNSQSGDSIYDWYIMPRIRIDSVFANNPVNQDTEVCKIIITNWDGDSLTQILKVKHFKKSIDNVYNGYYLELYNSYSDDSLKNFHITSGKWFNLNQHDPFGHNDGKVDFKVFWYDKCDMWIDRIRVENEPVRKLMTVQDTLLVNQLKYEIKDIAYAMRQSLHSKYEPYKFYIEEFEMNNLPTIGYVNKMIRDLTDDSMSLMVNYNYDLVRAFIPNKERYDFTPDMIVRYLVDSAKIREIFTEC